MYVRHVCEILRQAMTIVGTQKMNSAASWNNSEVPETLCFQAGSCSTTATVFPGFIFFTFFVDLFHKQQSILLKL